MFLKVFLYLNNLIIIITLIWITLFKKDEPSIIITLIITC